MERRHQDVLRRMRQNIVDDLDVNNGIIIPLTTEFILREEDVIKIKKGKTKPERAAILLDLLPLRGSRAFEVFHQSLKHHYDWLSDGIDNMLESARPGTPVSDTPFFSPNLQPVSPLTVRRGKMIEELKSGLKNLQSNGYIALHGMKGFGKSCLTASTLHDKDLTSQLFNNEIYWIKFNYKRHIHEEILIQLNNLYHQIKNYNPLIESINTEFLENSLKQAIDNHFKISGHNKALLILDDVSDKQIIDKFDFSCKTLVITSDIGVLENRCHIFVAIDHGFTEDETLGLFAKVLNIGIDELPEEAKQINAECKGMPLLIAMFAAQFENFKYDMKDKNRKGRWGYYLNSLRTKNEKNKVIEQFLKIQEATFDMCIGQLKKEMKERYEQLAIFSEDVNIMPKTLEILWKEEPFIVDEQMLDFCHKSLAAKKWNDELRSYIYGIHDLLLCHLRKKLLPEQLRDKHRVFIERYKTYCNGDFSKLPNDNYSLSYIGHHLEQAEYFDEFPSLYTNFEFLQAKINYTGLNDLLIDLKKYRKYITNNGNKTIEANLQDLEKFLEKQATTLAKHRLMKCLDLVQIALDHSDEGFVKDTAKQLALSKQFSLYLSHDKNSFKNNYLKFSQEVTTQATCIAFTNDPNHILIGSIDGEVVLWDYENCKPKMFHGHNKKYPIKKIVLSDGGSYFLALSEDGTCKLFALNSDEFTGNGLNIPAQSPRHKQTFWTNIFDSIHDDSLKTFAIKHEFITDMKFTPELSEISETPEIKKSDIKIAACTNAGTVALWNENGNLEWQDAYKTHYFGGVAFTSGDKFLHVMNETISVVRIYKKNQNSGYTYLSQFNLQLDSPKVIYFSKNPNPIENNCLVIVTDKMALYLKWFSQDQEYLQRYEKYIKIEEKSKNTFYTAATLTYDARYLVISNSKGTISVLKAFNADDLITYFKGYVTSLDSYYFNEENHLICGSENRIIYMWDISADEKPKSVKTLLFDAKMANLGEDNTVFLKTLPNTITIYNGNNELTKIESLHGKISSINLSNDAKKLIYMTELGSVVIYEVATAELRKISQLDSVDNYIDILELQDNYFVLCRTADNNMQVSRSPKASQSLENTGYVISINKLNDESVMTVSKEGKIICWIIEDYEWRSCYECIDENGTIIHSCLSIYKTFLALLKDEQILVIYRMPDMDTIESNLGKLEIFMKHSYKNPLSSCQFSQDEKYLAVALEGGDISIIDVMTSLELARLSLHCSTVCQLHWSPITINVPILLSVGCDELAWWNVSFLKTPDRSQNRRSRMGFSRSVSSPIVGMSPRSSYRLPNSPMAPPTSPSVNVNEFWSRKLQKTSDADRPALLCCIQLPATCAGPTKVCVSDDFAKFLTVDIHGTVSNYTIFGSLAL
ncbi:hypothetical protein TSAR_009640 [Trichomalopsis sarcophagae]|uniref:CARD domain-containing protein n=1 Tax=Trichomalopsis sarcophagae TaxID=543379 RepID=A0A232FCQ4_9HYME|nr:hypothetical protein TSAR_009640 [Trichomalopsis sarcophagae]